MSLLLITAVDAEAAALADVPDALVVVAGIGRTNAAAATTQAILEHGPFKAVCSIGVAGALPGAELQLGETIVAEACIYAEEGLQTSEAFLDMQAMGFPLGDFTGNRVPVDADLLARLQGHAPTGLIATVATCSGSDLQAQTIARRTRGIAEAMEGAAVVHAARRLGAAAIELRTISNTTGDREQQQWDLPGALDAMARDVPPLLQHLRN
jgi:futalosine hydrolase